MSGFTHLEWKWAARRRGLKLLATASLDRLMLFNLSADPHEQEDLLAASGDGALALAGEVAALRDVIVAVRAAPQRHYATDPRRDLCHVGRPGDLATFSHAAPAGHKQQRKGRGAASLGSSLAFFFLRLMCRRCRCRHAVPRAGVRSQWFTQAKPRASGVV